MSPALSDLIDRQNLKRLWLEVYETRRQCHAGLTPAAGEQPGFDDWGHPCAKHGSYSEKEDDEEDRHAGRLLLADATEKLRRAMYDIGRAVALDPTYKAKADADQGTFYKLFGSVGLDTILLQEPAAKEGFLEGKESARIG
jgi:hypothetical protein